MKRFRIILGICVIIVLALVATRLYATTHSHTHIPTKTHAVTPAPLPHTNPNVLRVRKSIYALTPDELQRFINVLNTIRNNGEYQKFRDRHHHAMLTETPPDDPDTNRSVAHRGPSFLPWHREFIYEFEDVLLRVDPSVTLPYWPFEQESAWRVPRVFTSGYFGGDGNEEQGNKVTDGPFVSWGIIRLIARDPNTKQTTLPTTKDLNKVMQQQTYETAPYIESSVGFNMAMEGWAGNKAPWGMHNQVHGYIGGDMGGDKDGPLAGMNAVNDPIFFLVHANVDRIWWEWQQQHGIDNYQPVSDGPEGHNLNDQMQFLLHPTKPSDVLDIQKMYYQYE